MRSIVPSLLLALLLLGCTSVAAPLPPTATALQTRTAGTGQTGQSPSLLRNPGGFELTLPAGWQIIQNEGLPGLGGSTIAPAGSSATNPQQAIIVHLGDQPALVRATLPITATVEDVLVAMLARYNSDPQSNLRDIQPPQHTTLGGEPARAQQVIEVFADGRERTIRTVASRRADGRWLMLYAAAPTAQWDAALVDQVQASLRMVEPQLAHTPLYPLPSDAQDVSASGEQMSFVSEQPPAVLVAFLRDAFSRGGAREDVAATQITSDTFVLRFTDWQGSPHPIIIYGSTLPAGSSIGTPGQTVVSLQPDP